MTKLADKTIIYVTRDLERALGPQTIVAAYFIITNSTPFAKELSSRQKNILLINSPELLDTHELLVHPETSNYLEKLIDPQILVFKNTSTIEQICADKGWGLLNPAAQLANKIEEKISQVEWLDDLTKFLPPHKIILLKEVKFDHTPFIIQFNRAHTGNGTILIDSEKVLIDLQQKFPDRPVRVTTFVKGTMFTSNNVVFSDQIIVGNRNVQITGLAPFTDQPFATIGNDWSLGTNRLTSAQFAQYQEMVIALGEKLRASGWRGLFGTDFILADTGELYLIEINARQPAGTTFESQLQSQLKTGLTTFSLHLLSLLGEPLTEKTLAPVESGAQIILRNQTTIFSESCLTVFSERLKTAGFTVIRYQNTEPGSDLIRIQSNAGIMNTPNTFNKIGESIVQALHCSI